MSWSTGLNVYFRFCWCHCDLFIRETQFQTKLTGMSVAVFHHALLTKINILNHWSSLPASVFVKMLFIFLVMCMCLCVSIHTSIRVPVEARGIRSPLELESQAMWDVGIQLWSSVEQLGFQAWADPPYFCLLRSEGVLHPPAHVKGTVVPWCRILTTLGSQNSAAHLSEHFSVSKRTKKQTGYWEEKDGDKLGS